MLSHDLEGLANTFATHADNGGATLTQAECLALAVQAASLCFMARQVEQQVVPLQARITDASKLAENVVALFGKRQPPVEVA